MSRRAKIVVWVVAVAVVAVAAGGVAVLRDGFSARDAPWGIEAFLARRLRRLAIPAAARQTRNPLPVTPEVVSDARDHFADHC